MMKKDLLEAERIAGELFKVDSDFKRTGQEGLNVGRLETMILAKAVQIFEAKLEAEQLSSTAQAQREHQASL